MAETIVLVVVHGDEETTLEVEVGANLRTVLLEADLPVYGMLSRYANGGGRGLCSTCTVEVEPAPPATHWHDAAAVRFGYPRLSCCTEVSEPIRVRLLDKPVWGQVLPRRLGADE